MSVGGGDAVDERAGEGEKVVLEICRFEVGVRVWRLLPSASPFAPLYLAMGVRAASAFHPSG